MPGPSKYNRKLKAKNDARKPAPSAGGRTASEAAFGRSQVAAGKKVSRSNLRQSRPQALPKTSIARRSVLAEPRVVTAIERLRNKYGSEKLTKGSREGVEKSMEVSERQARRERNLENDFLRTLPTRAEALDAAPAVRQSTNLNAEGTRVEKLAGATQVGNEPFRAVRGALGQGKIKRRGNQFTTPKVRRTERKVKKAKRQLRKAKAATRTPRKNLMRAGLDAEQAKVLSTVLNVGRKRGATKKEMLAAVETALVESNIRNLDYGDADSLGWRQERASVYPGKNLLDVKAAANRFFDESVSDANRGPGMTAGQLAQAIQASAFPEKYDQRKGEAVPLLKAFNSAGSASPKAKARLRRAEARAKAVDRKAANLGIRGVSGNVVSEDRYEGPLPENATVWPLAIKGEWGGGPEAHATRPFYNWQSDNAVDINVPVGTPVRAVRDGVITRTSGSPPNHSANPAGWNVYLKDNNGVEYFYAHLENFSVKPGDRVKAGDVIARSGAANGVAHLHFATPYDVDPEAMLRGATTKASGPSKPRFINFSKKGGAGTSQSKWLVPTGGNEVLKFQRPLANALVRLAKASGEPIRINSGFRSRAEQEALYQAFLNGTGNLAAEPGTSKHEFGAAADVELTARQRELAPQFGLTFPVSGEPWHIEHKDALATGAPPGGGGGGGTIPVSPPSGGGVTGGGTTASGKKRQREEMTSLDLLRKLGYRVTSRGIKRTGLADSGVEDTPSVSEVKRRYGIK